MISPALHNPVLPLLRTLIVVIMSMPLLSGCSLFSRPADGPPNRAIDVSSIPNAVPRREPRAERGNPTSYEVNGRTYRVMASAAGYDEQGVASWYGTKFHGHSTSSGEPYDMYKMTAAHRSLPIPCYVEVTNLQNHRRVIVRVNDRGPFHENRIIDLSYAAARKLGINGTGLVRVRSVEPGQQATPATVASNASPNPRTAAPVANGHAPKMYVQAGAFGNRNNAEQLEQQLRPLLSGKPIISEYDQSKRLYLVRIGPLASVDEADRLTQLITDNGFDTPHIIID